MNTPKKLTLILVLLITSFILISSVSATDETDNLEVANYESSIEINNTAPSNVDNSVLGTDNHKTGEGYIEFEKNNYEIEEKQQDVTIKGTVFMCDDLDYEYFKYWEELNLNCHYTDGNGVARSYTLTSNEDGIFEFNLNQCEGLIASNSPYILTFSPVDDNAYANYLTQNDDNPLVDSWVSLTVKESQEVPSGQETIYVGPDGTDNDGYGVKDNPYKTIAYAISKANDGAIIYIYNGTYDENSITLDKNLTLIGESRNVLITSSKTAQGQKIFEDTSKNDNSYKFINLTFTSISFGANSYIFNLQNTGTNEITNCDFNDLTLRVFINSISSETKISDCNFNNCAVNQAMTGAMIYIGGKSTISNTKFINSQNKAASSYVNLIQTPVTTTLNINNVIISDTTGKYNLIYTNKDSTVTIKDSQINNNNINSQSAMMGGMLVYAGAGANVMVNITDSVIANNTIANGIFYGTSNTAKFIMNNDIIYNNTGKIMVNANPEYDFEYNYWGLNAKLDTVTVTNWIVVESTVNPDSVFDNEKFTVTAELKMNNSDGNTVQLDKNLPEIPVTFEYNNAKVTNMTNGKKATATFTFNNAATEITTTVINEKLTNEVSEKELVIYVGPDGVDGEGYGTKNKPYKTIKYAVSKADQGYTIYIGAVHYLNLRLIWGLF